MSGLTVGASNRTLATVGLDGALRTWDFRRQKLTGAGRRIAAAAACHSQRLTALVFCAHHYM